MTEHQDSRSVPTARERELELEVARLQAELDTLRGEDPSAATTRLLTMAAATADAAVADARREADEIVEEISGQAEARRDEATRVAAEAEAIAEEKLAEADRAQEKVEEAEEHAASITEAAQVEADAIVSAGRESLAVEAEAFAEMRVALEEERAAIESYHEGLRRRVQELAESMVTFMDNELPTAGAGTLGAVPSAELAVGADDVAVETVETTVETDAVELVDELDDIEVVDEGDVADEADGVDPLDAPSPSVAVADQADDPWIDMLEAAIPEQERREQDAIVDMPDTAIEEIPSGPPATFGGAPVVDDDAEEIDIAKPASGGLFSRARADETVLGFDDLAAEDEDDNIGLFSSLGPRLVEQTRAEELADALDDDDGEDHAFREFLDGDDAPDPSRDWLLRPEQG